MCFRSFVFLAVIFVSCKNNTPRATDKKSLDTTKQNAITSAYDTTHLSESRINQFIDTLQNLSIVKEASRIIDSASMGSRHISFIPDSVAYPNGELYIAAGDNRPERFETFINFYINVNTHNIRVYDVVRDDTVDVNVYERRQKISWKQ